MLSYWHPLAASRSIPRSRVIRKKLCGVPIAVFRAETGELGALVDECAHRRMKLSLGKVCERRLVCPYHGWSFSREGQGESPSAPKLHASIVSYDCVEVAEVVWLRRGSENGELPGIETPADCLNAGVVFNRVRAPLELVIDNFSEVEHTVTTHPDFGFDAVRAAETVVELQTTPESVTVSNRGPAKLPPVNTRLALGGIRKGDLFHSNYTLRFDPPRSSVTHFWTDAKTGVERMVKYHVIHYFVPEDSTTTSIVTFAFLRLPAVLERWLGWPAGFLFRRKAHRTVEEDAFLLENLADQSPELRGMKLGRFDSVLRLTRERLQKIYYGDTPQCADERGLSPGRGRSPDGHGD